MAESKPLTPYVPSGIGTVVCRERRMDENETLQSKSRSLYTDVTVVAILLLLYIGYFTILFSGHPSIAMAVVMIMFIGLTFASLWAHIVHTSLSVWLVIWLGYLIIFGSLILFWIAGSSGGD